MEKEERMRWLRTRESKSKEKDTVELAKKGRRMKGGKERAEEKSNENSKNEENRKWSGQSGRKGSKHSNQWVEI
jgi:hypothetical protein